MHKITNNTNGPLDLRGVHGNVRVPAFGAVSGEFEGEYIELLRSSGAVTVEVVKPKGRGKRNGNNDVHE